MINVGHDLPPILLAGMMAFITCYIRNRSAKQVRDRIAHLTTAAEMLKLHARALEYFLSDPAAPILLKRALLLCSDAMADRATVERVVEWASSRPFDVPFDTEEFQALDSELANLHAAHPDLVDNFGTAILSAMTGATLRWPESAALFDQVFPRLVGTPKRDVAIAATAASFWPGVPFSLKPAEPAMVA